MSLVNNYSEQSYTHNTSISIKSSTVLKISFVGLLSLFLSVLFVFKVIAVLISVKTHPIFPFDYFDNCFVAGDSCPNENVTFWMYTR